MGPNNPVLPRTVKVLVLAVAGAFSGSVPANPTGANVVSGLAIISNPAANVMQIRNSPGTIIQWNGFSIQANETTRFLQDNAASAVLNRVVGALPSSILGRLESNGRVFLVNPNGIVFGRGAQVDVAGLVASSLNLSNADFLAGRLNFTQAPGAGAVVNQGAIHTASGGSVYLVGPAVANHGIISSPRGEVVLAAGNSVELVDPGTPNLRVQVAAPDNQALNLGQITAEAGRVGIYAGLVSTSGSIRADSAVAEGGRIVFKATKQVAINGEVRADGVSGGAIDASAGGDALLGGLLSATGSAGAGGSVRVSGRDVFQTSASRVDAGSVGGSGGSIDLRAAAGDGVLFASGSLAATGARGGDIRLLGDRVTLWGARADASGDAKGGTILIGGDFQGANAAVPNASSTFIAPSTALKADARDAGDGGKVIVWADGRTAFYGSASARGGARGGDGGFIEVSGKQSLSYGGTSNAGAPNGRPGTLLLDPRNLTIGNTSGITSDASLFGLGLDDGDGLGSSVVVIKDEMHVVLAPQRDFSSDVDAGAFYVMDTLAGLMSMGTGGASGTRVGSGGVTVLANGNALVSSPDWRASFSGDANLGAVTWVNGTTGLQSDGGTGGTVNSFTSVVGSSAIDRVGSGGILPLSGGNALVLSPDWNGTRGAATWINGATGALVDGNVGGQVAAANSLVGSAVGDQIASGGGVALTGGNVIVRSPMWNGARGAATWMNGATGALTDGTLTGAAVSITNSLTGATAGDMIGSGGVTALANGNALVASPNWDNGGTANAGAVTWINGANGRLYGGAAVGVVSTANSIHGTQAGDQVGSGGVTALPNGNALILSPEWDYSSTVNAGAFTWVSGATGGMSDIDGIASGPGAVSYLNSHYGSTAGDRVGTSVTVLANGHALVRSANFQEFGADTGAVTWVNSADGRSDPTYDQFMNAYFDFRVSSQNSLVGRYAGDRIGSGGIVALPGGNAIVLSPEWNSGSGAATWLSGTTGRHANYNNSLNNTVDSSSSLVGFGPGDRIGSGGVTVLPGNGNAIIRSPETNDGAGGVYGMVTWVNGASGHLADGQPMGSGFSTSNHSFFGAEAGDRLGSGGVVALATGNALVVSPFMADGGTMEVGAIHFINGSNGQLGGPANPGATGGNLSAQSATLRGVQANSRVGSGGVFALSTGNALALSPEWGESGLANLGAATILSGITGEPAANTFNQIGSSNSIIGSQAGDRVGSGGALILGNGNVVVLSPAWQSTTGFPSPVAVPDAGAATWLNGATGHDSSGTNVGRVDSSTSIVGGTAGDRVGSGGAVVLANNNVAVRSPEWDDFAAVDAGAVSWIDGATGRLASGSGGGGVDMNNSVIGTTAGERLGSGDVRALPDGRFLVQSPLHDRSPSEIDVGELYQVTVNAGYAPGWMTYGYRPAQDITLSAASIASTLATGTSLVLQANNDITVADEILVSNPLGNGGNLTLQAGRSVLMNGFTGITTDNGNVTLIGNDLAANGVVEANRGGGAAVIRMDSGSYINAGTGTVTVSLRDGADRMFSTTSSGAVTLHQVTASQLDVTNAGSNPASASVVLNGQVNVTGNVDIQSTGSISASGQLAVGGTMRAASTGMNTDGQVHLDHTGNAFAGLVTLQGTGIRLRAGSGDLLLAPLSSEKLDVTLGGFGDLKLSGSYATVAGSGSYDARMDLSATGMRLEGNTTLTSPGHISLNGPVRGAHDLTIVNPGSNATGVSFNGTLGDTSMDPGDRLAALNVNTDSAGFLILPSIEATGAVTLRGGYVSFFGNVSSQTLTAEATGGDLTIASGMALSASGTGNALVLAASGNFVNDAGAGALSAPNGRWLVYSTSSADSTESGLTGAAGSAIPRLYNRTYAANVPSSIAQPGNHLIYSAQPTLNVSANAASRPYGDANPTFAYATTGFVNDDGVTDTLPQVGLTGVLATTAVANSSVAGGPYSITAGTLASSSGYGVSYTGANLTVTPRGIAVTADDKSKVYGNADPALTFTVGGGGLAGGDTVGTAFSGALTRTAGETVLGGPYAISQNTLAANGNYNVTTFTGGQFSITQRPVTVTADAGQTKVYGNADPGAYTYTNSSLGTGLALVGALDRAAGESVGGYAIGQGTLTNGANPNYLLTHVGANFSITQRPVTVTADAGQAKVYGNADPGSYTYTNSSLGTGVPLAGALDRAAGENVGGHAIGQGTLSTGNNPNYLLTYVGDNFSITQRPVTVTADAGQAKVYGNADPGAYTYTNTSLGTGVALAGALDRAAGENAGGYAIGQGTLTNTNNTNYLLTYVGDNFSVAQRPLSVVAGSASRNAAAPNPPLTATLSGFAPGEGIGNLTGSLALTTAALVDSPTGSYAIQVSGLSSPNYLISFVAGTLTVLAPDAPPVNSDALVAMDRALQFASRAGLPAMPAAQCREVAPRVLDCR